MSSPRRSRPGSHSGKGYLTAEAVRAGEREQRAWLDSGNKHIVTLRWSAETERYLVLYEIYFPTRATFEVREREVHTDIRLARQSFSRIIRTNHIQ